MIEYLIYNPKYIKIIDFFFPFQHFKSKEMEVSCYFIEMISILYNKQINFKLQFVNLNDTKERKIYKFKFNDNKNKLCHNFIFDSDPLIIGKDSNLSIDGKTIPEVIVKEKESNINKTIQLISLVIDLSDEQTVTIEKLKKANKKNIINNSCTEKKLLTTSYFCFEDNNLISRMWSLIYNLGPLSPIIDFLIQNLIPIESETLEFIKEKYLNIGEINDIEKYITFISKMKSFCNLWKS